MLCLLCCVELCCIGPAVAQPSKTNVSGGKDVPKMCPLLPAGLLGTSLRTSPFSQASGEGESPQARSSLALIALILCVPTSPNEEKALKPAAACYSGAIRGKKESLSCCDGLCVVIHHLSPSIKDKDAGTRGCWVPTPITEGRGPPD